MSDPASATPESAPPANDHTLLELRLMDGVAATVAVDAVGQTLRGLGFTAAVLDSLTTVLDQLLLEARGREVFADDPPVVQVTLSLHGNQALVRVSDLRMPQWGEGLKPCRSDQLVRQSRLDGFHRGEQGNSGNWSECVLNLQAAAPGTPPDLEMPTDTPRVTAAAAAAVQLRELLAADAEGLVRLIYRVYGYSYPKPEFYSLEEIRRLLKVGGLRGIVAIDDTGQVVGHVAIVPDTPYLTCELGRLAVDPGYRGHNLASRLTNQVLAVAGRAGIPALWAECVANHPASQRVLLAAGGTEVGLLLDAFPAMRMSRFAAPLQARQSLVPIAKVLAPRPSFRAHLPAHLEPIYRQLIGQLGLQRDLDTSDRTPAGTLALRVALLPQINGGFVAVDHLGSGGLKRVRSEMAAMIQARVAVIYLDIPLAEAGAGHAIEAAYQHGFIWGMLFPCARPDGDVLRLQWLGSQVLDVNGITCATAHGRAMKEWVLGERQRGLGHGSGHAAS